MAEKTKQKSMNKLEKNTAAKENTLAIVSSPFSQDRLNEIFKLSATNPNKIISRESSSVEFKESFGWKSCY